MEFDLEKLVRDNIKVLKPYSSARDEFKGQASVFLDANENAYGSPLPDNFNRYPDPLQWQLKYEIEKIKGVPAKNIFIGNGSDEAIDLAFRIFCRPGIDNVIIAPPTYGMYEVSASINDVEIKKVKLLSDFQLDVPGILEATDEETKLIFICSPNNPTGNNMKQEDIEMIINNFAGIVIIDEAYINFSRQKTFISQLTKYPNLLVMQTLSKAWGLASLRVGMAFASLDIINLFNKVKPPYNINAASQLIALDALQNTLQVNNWTKEVVDERKILGGELVSFPFVLNVYDSDANFLLLKVADANPLYDHLSAAKIVVRNRSKDFETGSYLRITVGTPAENKILLEAFKNYK